MPPGMGQVIACVSAKGGVGKTTTSINLGAALNFFGQKVTVVDGNLTTPHVGLHLGVPILPITVHDVLQGRNKVQEALYQHKSGMCVVPGSIALDDLKKLDAKRLVKTVRDLRNESDLIILDSAAGLGREALACIESADKVLVITNPEMPALTDALKVINLCKEMEKEVTGVVVTKTNVKNVDIPLKTIEEILEVPVIGVVPEDRSVKFALADKDAVVHTHPRSAAAIQYKKLAAHMLGRTYDEEPQAESSGFLNALLDLFGLTRK